MRDYKLLAEGLRYCSKHICNKECGYYEICHRDCGKEYPSVTSVGFDAADAIEEMLAAVPKRGEWLITDAYPHRVYCSVCYKTYLPNADWELWSDGRIPRNFCPHCGARMTEVSEDA